MERMEEQRSIDEKFMRLALNEARKAFDEQEVPIGAVVVAGGTVVGRGHNLVETLADPTAHAEMQALTAASSTLGGKYLPDSTLYVTVEPCMGRRRPQEGLSPLLGSGVPSPDDRRARGARGRVRGADVRIFRVLAPVGFGGIGIFLLFLSPTRFRAGIFIGGKLQNSTQ